MATAVRTYVNCSRRDIPPFRGVYVTEVAANATLTNPSPPEAAVAVRPNILNLVRAKGAAGNVGVVIQTVTDERLVPPGTEFEICNISDHTVAVAPPAANSGVKLVVFAINPYLVRKNDAVILKYLGEQTWVFIGRPY